VIELELLTIGRISVDLYAEQLGVPRADVQTFAKFLGGSATNVAVAAARLGDRSAVITKVGDDPFGPYVRRALKGFGVDARFVGTHPTLRTPIVFCEIHPPDDFPLLFYREPTAPDMTITVDELDLDEIRSARVFWTTGTGLSADPSRAATIAALEARDGVDGGFERLHQRFILGVQDVRSIEGDGSQWTGHVQHYGALGHGYACPTRRDCAVQKGSRTTRRWILPVAVRGNAVTKSTERGRWNPPSLSRQKSTSSCSLARMPARSTTTALTLSPQ